MNKLTMKTIGTATRGQFNAFRRFVAITLAAMAMFCTGGNVWAQCDDITVSAVATPSSCFADGTIQVTLSGDLSKIIIGDGVNAEQYALKAVGADTYILNFSHVPNGLITGVAPGTYTVEVRAFCYDANDWTIFTGASPVVVGGNYQAPSIGISNSRKSLSCMKTGNITMTLTGGNAPFSVEITSKPAAYTGPTMFTGVSRTTANTPFLIEDLAPGTYTLKIVDACDYSVERTAIVGTMESDVYTPLLNVYSAYLPLVRDDDCKTINFVRKAPTGDADATFYYSRPEDYYEIGFSETSGVAPSTWTTYTVVPGSNNGRGAYTMSKPYKDMYGKNIYIYVRVKDCPASMKGPEILKIEAPEIPYSSENRPSWANIGGCDIILRFGQHASPKGLICYPYTWVITAAGGSTVCSGTGTEANDYQTSSTLTPNKNYTLTCTDAQGYSWSTPFSFKPNPPENFDLRATTYPACINTVRNFYITNNTNIPIRPGTKIETISYPAGLPADTRMSFTVPEDNQSSLFYPIVTNDGRTIRPPAGSYTFRITDPCTGATSTVRGGLSDYTVSNLGYIETARACGGKLTILPSGTLTRSGYGPTFVYPANLTTFYIAQGVNASGNIRNLNTAISYPPGTPIELPSPGTYTIALRVSTKDNTADFPTCNSATFTVVNDATEPYYDSHSSYVCIGESLGQIQVNAAGGIPPYTFELVGSGLPPNQTGHFSYGHAGETYTVRVTDACGASFPKDIEIFDLNVGSILTPAKFTLCEGEDIVINCISMGNTTYTWTLPDGSTRNTRNLTIPNATQAHSGQYTMNVKPEFCNNPVTKSVNITVKDCSTPILAVDDYVAIWECEDATIDVLANDSFDGTVGIAIVNQGTYGNSVAGSNVTYTSKNNCADGAGKTDIVRYKICPPDDNSNCSEANIYITLMKKPAIHLLDSCSTEPKLRLDLQYAGATYQWQRSADGSTNWTTIAGATGPEIVINETGYYRVLVTYNGKTITTPVVHPVVLKAVLLPDGAMWYSIAMN